MKSHLPFVSLLILNIAGAYYLGTEVLKHLERTENAAVAAQSDREFQTLGHYSPGKFCVIAATEDVDEEEFSRLALACSRKHHAYLLAQEAINAKTEE
jgi:hypothetical protein